MSLFENKTVLITGGVKSGKSNFALKCAKEFEGVKAFIATATASDAYMEEKIKKHQQQRNDQFFTVEEPVFLARAIQSVEQRTENILIDCLTLWVNNLLYHFKDNLAEINHQIDLFEKEIQAFNGTMLIVTNEVGLGVMPDNALAQKYVDLLGRINQCVAQSSDEVVMMISGIPQLIKSCLSSESNFYEKIDSKF